MAQLIWSPEAVEDLKKIADFIALHAGNPRYVRGENAWITGVIHSARDFKFEIPD